MQAWENHPHKTPREWQAKALPVALQSIKAGRRVIVRACTGAGKTWFVAEVVRMAQAERVIIVAPTEQLVEDMYAVVKQRNKSVGRYYGKVKDIARKSIIITCNPSLPNLARQVAAPDLLIIDEAHESECDTFHNVFETWSPDAILGMTATPYRANDTEKLRIFESLIWNYGPAEAIRDGVVVPPVFVHPTPSEAKLEDVNEVMAAMIQRHIHVGPGVVDAINIADAQEFVAILIERGIKADIVHSAQGSGSVAKKIKLIEAGKLDVIVHVKMLSRGVDIPCLKWIGCRRPIKSRTLFAQYIGRGIRSFAGKTQCLILDPHNLVNVHSLSPEAAIGGGEEEVDDVTLALKVEDIISDLREDDMKEENTLHGVPIKAIDPCASYVLALRLRMEMDGVIPFDANLSITRNDPVTADLVNLVGEKMSVVNTHPDIPYEHRRALWIAYRSLRAQRRGIALDMNKILKVIRHKGWPFDDPVAI